jgi:hypothetical protein
MNEPTPSEQLEIIERNWYQEAMAYKAAGVLLRSCLESAERSKAVDERHNRLERSDALCDAWLDIRLLSGLVSHPA